MGTTLTSPLVIHRSPFAMQFSRMHLDVLSSLIHSSFINFDVCWCIQKFDTIFGSLEMYFEIHKILRNLYNLKKNPTSIKPKLNRLFHWSQNQSYHQFVKYSPSLLFFLLIYFLKNILFSFLNNKILMWWLDLLF